MNRLSNRLQCSYFKINCTFCFPWWKRVAKPLLAYTKNSQIVRRNFSSPLSTKNLDFWRYKLVGTDAKLYTQYSEHNKVIYTILRAQQSHIHNTPYIQWQDLNRPGRWSRCQRGENIIYCFTRRGGNKDLPPMSPAQASGEESMASANELKIVQSCSDFANSCTRAYL